MTTPVERVQKWMTGTVALFLNMFNSPVRCRSRRGWRRSRGGVAGSVRHMECPGPASVVFDKSLTEYDFGPGHPMSPVRVDLTMRLAEELGVLEHLRMVEAPIADDDLIATVHDRG